MTTVIDLSPEELAEIQELTEQSDVSQALRTAMEEYVRYARRMRLKKLSGRVQMDESWKAMDAADLKERNERHGG